MHVHLYAVSGYAEAIMSLRMSKGKACEVENAQAVQDLIYLVTDRQGFLESRDSYNRKLEYMRPMYNTYDYKMNRSKIVGDYDRDIGEFKRLLGLVMSMAMQEQKHHTLMKYIDISFLTYGLHRGAQDDLDAHAMGFNNRITRFSTRLANIHEPKLSEWYADKLITFDDAHSIIFHRVTQDAHSETDEEMRDAMLALQEVVSDGESFAEGTMMPKEIVLYSRERDTDETYVYTPFGYMLKKFAEMPQNNGLYKDVARGGMPLGMESNALWKSDMFNLRYIYHMRSRKTKANPELREAIEMLAHQIEMFVPVFGEHFKQVWTDSGQWEHTNRVKTVTTEEYETFKRWREKRSAFREYRDDEHHDVVREVKPEDE